MKAAHITAFAAGTFVAAALCGCGIHDPYQAAATSTAGPATSSSTPTATGSPGETPAPPPPTPAAQTPIGLQPTPQQAIAEFARLYTNWSWRTLTANQLRLAQISTGAARLAEQQAAAASRSDTTITRGRIYNQGQLISAAPSLATPDQWVVVTREQTGGNSEYDGLQASYHVTLAQLTKLPQGWAIATWQPQQ